MFRNAIVTGCVMDGKFLCGASGLEMTSEFLPKVLPSTVRMQDFDRRIVLGEKVNFELLVGWKGIIFSSEEVDVSETCLVVDETDIVSSSL